MAKKVVKKVKKAAKTTAKKVTAKKASKSAKPAKAKSVVKKVEKPKAAAKKAVKKVEVKPSAIKPVVKLKTDTEKVVDAVIFGMQEKKAKNLVCMDLSKITSAVCKYFVICEAESNTQVNSIADSVEEQVRKLTNRRPYHAEGYQNSEWILIDYIDVVVHVFQPDIRKFYNLEGLWADADVKHFQD